MAFLKCVESFAYTAKGGAQRVIRQGDVIDAADAAVKGREQFFQSVEASVEQATDRAAGKVEQSTRAPGEKSAARRTEKV